VRSAIEKGWTIRKRLVTFVLAVNVNQAHWGACRRGRGEGIVYWGDSMGSGSPYHLLAVVRDSMNSFDGIGIWEVDAERNYMTDVLQYGIKTDGYSCGFFMCSLGEFPDISELPDGTYRTEGTELTERIRDVCITTFLNSVIRLCFRN